MAEHTCNWTKPDDYEVDAANECEHGVYRGAGPCPVCDCQACAEADVATMLATERK